MCGLVWVVVWCVVLWCSTLEEMKNESASVTSAVTTLIDEYEDIFELAEDPRV